MIIACTDKSRQRVINSSSISGRLVISFFHSSVDESWWKDSSFVSLIFGSVLWSSCPPAFAASRSQNIAEDIAQLRFWAWLPDLAQFDSETIKNYLLWDFSSYSDIFFLCKSHLRTCFYSACQYVHAWRLYWEDNRGKALGFLDTFLQKLSNVLSPHSQEAWRKTQKW